MKKKNDAVPQPAQSSDVLQEEDSEIEKFTISKEDLKRLQKKNKVKGGSKDIEYTVYESAPIGRIANSSFESLSDYFIHKYPALYKTLKISLVKSDVKFLSRTYVSIILFSGFLAFLGAFVITAFVTFFLGGNIFLNLVKSVAVAFLLGSGTLAFVYFYPSFIIKNRNRAIAADLPFVIIHMAAVAGSGAQPISIFNLVLNTGEYKGLEKEIRKIVNYVNLFGYDLTTALRNVANTTPSPKFRELLNGIVTTLETGGDLKYYLQEKATEALSTYKLERKKYVEAISTYSDIYVSVLIAAPLLFIVTLAMINVLGGSICFGGFCTDSRFLALAGTFVAIPFLNVFFLVFLNLVQPEG